LEKYEFVGEFKTQKMPPDDRTRLDTFVGPIAARFVGISACETTCDSR
jgi:hypothetical protein